MRRDALLFRGFRCDAALLGRVIDGLLLASQPLVASIFLWVAIDGDQGHSALWCAALLFVILVIRRLLLWPVSRRLYASAYGGGLRLRRSILVHLIRMPLGAFRGIAGGKLIQAVSEDVLWLENHLSYTRPEIAANAATLCICLVGATVAWPVIGLTTIVVMMAGFGILTVAKRLLAAGLERRAQSLASTALNLQEQAEGISVLRTFASEGDVGHDFTRNVTRLRDGAWRGVRQVTPIATLFRMTIEMSVAVAVLVAVAAFDSASGTDIVRLTIGILLIVSATVPARNFASLTAMLILARIARRNIDAIFSVPQTRMGEGARPDNFNVRYENVSFTYAGRQTPALSGVSFEAKQGQMIALVGANGSGKTTCLQLLMRFMEPDSGTIFIGDRDIRQFDYQTLASMIAPVFQETLLFSSTIADNIRIARPQASDAEVEAAARAAAVHDTIMGFSDGYATTVGALGARLSGGERQRICIARAILKNSPIVLLDEATSALDPESEDAIQRAIAALAVGRTLFVIVHNLPSIVTADCIILLEEGHVSACGTHDVMLKTSAAYRQLWNRSEAALGWQMMGQP